MIAGEKHRWENQRGEKMSAKSRTIGRLAAVTPGMRKGKTLEPKGVDETDSRWYEGRESSVSRCGSPRSVVLSTAF